jgi:ribosomal protein S18 acetylase RimI-like enzyme
MRFPDTSLEIRPFEPHAATRDEWTRYHAYRRQRAAEEFPDLPLLSDDDFEHELRRTLALSVNRRLIAVRGGEIVGNMILGIRLAGTEGWEAYAPYVDVWGGVLMQCRRQGIGRALARALHGFMSENGKTTASLKVQLADGHGFLLAAGAAAKLRSAENWLCLADVNWQMLQQWQARIDDIHALRWEMHVPRVPMTRLAELMAPFSRLINEQPLGELDIPAMRYDIAGYEVWYREMDQRGGEHRLVMLMDGADVAAMCDASWDPRFPDRVHQALTAVAAHWRGKGLAKAVKAAMLSRLKASRPEVTTMVTLNANSNDAMLSINRRLGFRVHRQECTYQIRRDALAAFLAPAG